MIINFLKLTILIFTCSGITAQNICSQQQYEEQHLSKKNKTYLKHKIKHSHISKNFTSNTRDDTLVIPIVLHVIHRSNSTGGLSECEVIESVADLEEHFYYTPFEISVANILFHNSDAHYNIMSYNEADQLYETVHQPGAVNVFFVNYAIGSCGFANFPWDDKEYIMLKNSCALNGSTFSHELGHYLGLLHTHDTTLGYEYVVRIGCDNTGDLLCDTEADPNLNNKVYSNCTYHGNEFDLNQAPYTPNTNNLMSYSNKTCRNNFTPGQIDRMVYFYNDTRKSQLVSDSTTVLLSCPCEDLDNDGICRNVDEDDNDACLPYSHPELCIEDCVNIDFNNFDTNNLLIWNDGGSDCMLYNSNIYSSSGNYCVRLRDNSGIYSSIYSDPLDLTNYGSISVAFSYYAKSMETNEDFLFELSYDGGISFTTIQTWTSNEDFSNNIHYSESIDVLDNNFTNEMVLRFRCDASANYDMIFIDDIEIKGCFNEEPFSKSNNTDRNSINLYKEDSESVAIQIYPVPYNDEITISTDGDESLRSIYILTKTGEVEQVNMENSITNQKVIVNLSNLKNNSLYVKIQLSNGDVITKHIVRSII